MAKRFNFDEAITTDIKGAASDSYIDNIKMIKMTDIETNSENFYSLPDIEELAEDIERQGLIHSLAVTKTSYGTYKLISGHRRLSAIKLLSEKGKWNNGTVPCFVITAKKSEAEMNLDLIMLNHTQRKYSDADIFKEHEELKKIFTQLEADGVEIKGRLREKIAKAMHVSSAQIGKIENIKNNAIDSVKVAVENGELSISTANEIAKHNRCLKKQYGTNYQPSRFPKGTRKSLLLTLLCVFFVSPRKTYREHTNYRLSDRTTANTNIIRTKYRCENIRYGDLISAQGNNFAVKIPADQLGKIIVLPIFYSANVNLETNTAVITVKEYNKEIICQALGYDSKKIAQQSDKLINSQKYKRLKDYAASSNTKLSYMIVTKIQLELLKMNEIELAAFPKDDGKYNVAFMPDTKELITKILYPSDDSKQESEYERNSRINNEIKRLAAINGEKPKYRMVAPELLDNIKQSGIQFAYFKKGDKYNIVFLRENEMKIDQLLKQFRKKN